MLSSASMSILSNFGNSNGKRNAEIKVTVKLFSGLARELDVKDHDPSCGLGISVRRGTRLRRILKNMGMKNLSSYAYFCGGERISPWHKLQDGDEISCLRPSGGG